jgi:hypothetical protein
MGRAEWLNERLLLFPAKLKSNRRVQLLTLTIVVLLVLAVVVVWVQRGEPEVSEGPLVPEGYLEQYTYGYSREPAVDGHLMEGESIQLDFFSGVFPDVPEGYCFYLDEFWLYLEWSDGGDSWGGRLGYENAPDTFELRFWDEKGYFDQSLQGQNVHGERGRIELAWSTHGPYFCVGDPDALGEVDVEVDWDDVFYVEVTLIEAGDQSSPYVPIEYIDEDNSFFLHWGASGLFHEPGYED